MAQNTLSPTSDFSLESRSVICMVATSPKHNHLSEIPFYVAFDQHTSSIFVELYVNSSSISLGLHPESTVGP